MFRQGRFFYAVLCLIGAVPVHAQEDPPVRPEEGWVVFCSPWQPYKRGAKFTVQITDYKKRDIGAEGWPKEVTADENSRPVPFCEKVVIPTNVVETSSGFRVSVRDYRSESKALALNGNPRGDTDVSVEAVVWNDAAGRFEIDNIFGVVADHVGQDVDVLIPEVYADTDGDGQIADGDKLYALVDLNRYLPTRTPFAMLQPVAINAGAPLGIGDIRYSTTPFTFDDMTGQFIGSPYSGVGIVDGYHVIRASPEPATLAFLLPALAWIRRRS